VKLFLGDIVFILRVTRHGDIHMLEVNNLAVPRRHSAGSLFPSKATGSVYQPMVTRRRAPLDRYQHVLQRHSGCAGFTTVSVCADGETKQKCFINNL
jgi:hypothetical protein